MDNERIQGQGIIAVRRSLCKDCPGFQQIIFFHADFRNSLNCSEAHDTHATQWTMRHFSKKRWVVGEVLHSELLSCLLRDFYGAIDWHYRDSAYLPNLPWIYFSSSLEMRSIGIIITLVSVASNSTLNYYMTSILSCLILALPIHSPCDKNDFFKNTYLTMYGVIWAIGLSEW